MIPSHYMKNRCFTKHPLKNGCLGCQVCYIYIYMYMYFNRINAVVVLAWMRANRSIKLVCKNNKWYIMIKYIYIYIIIYSIFPWVIYLIEGKGWLTSIYIYIYQFKVLAVRFETRLLCRIRKKRGSKVIQRVQEFCTKKPWWSNLNLAIFWECPTKKNRKPPWFSRLKIGRILVEAFFTL